MIISKRMYISVLFCFAYLTFLMFSMLGHIPTVGGYLNEITNVGLVLFVIIIFLRLQDYSVKEGFIFLILLSYGLLLAMHTNDYAFFKLSLMIFAAKGIDFRKCIRFDLCARVVLTAIIVALFFCGIAPDVTSDYNGLLRHSIGFQNPNHVGMNAFIIIIEILYIAKMKLNILRYFLIFAILVAADRIAGSRTAEFIILISIILATVYSYRSDFYKKTAVVMILRHGAIICSIITFVVVCLYRAGNPATIILDRALSYRITNISLYYDELGISLFGGNSLIVEHTIDSVYGFSFIVLGIVTFTILLFFYYRLERILCDTNKPLAIIIFCFFLYGISERLWMYIDYNIFMLAFAELIYPYFSMDEGAYIYEITFIRLDDQTEAIQQYDEEEFARECFWGYDEPNSADMYSSIRLTRYDWENGVEEILETLEFGNSIKT